MAIDVDLMQPIISIHAPREGSDHAVPRLSHLDQQFQSTLPARGATDLGFQLRVSSFISIHAPREGSDRDYRAWVAELLEFQSTLPARGATPFAGPLFYAALPFQSTLPARGATQDGRERGRGGKISIHAPREGSDAPWVPGLMTARISIHAPREGSDVHVSDTNVTITISIHAPREGSDVLPVW